MMNKANYKSIALFIVGLKKNVMAVQYQLNS